MPEEEVRILKIQSKKAGLSFMVTIPKEVTEALNIKGGEKIKVLLDKERGRIIYEVLTRQ